MEVSEQVKNAYKSNSIHKSLIITFPEINLTIPHEQIYQESMKLKESIFEGNSIEFVGCIASSFEIQVHGIQDKLKGARINVAIKTDDTEPITLFNGIVDSAVMQTNRAYKKITAYDELYTKGNTDVASWYKSLIFPITLKNLRDSLFNYIGLTQIDIVLPNDSISIDRQYDPNTLQALSVIKAICQINGAFGIMNRSGLFEYRILGEIDDAVYPSEYLFPSDNLFPANPAVAVSAAERFAEEIGAEHFSFYKKVNYEEFEVKPVDKLTIRQSEDDAGISYGSGTNNYIIQGNMFTYGLSTDVLNTVARNIYPNVQGFSYYPFTSQNNGLPFIECGLDAVSYTMIDWEELYRIRNTRAYRSGETQIPYKQQAFYVLNRELSGIQALKDSYGANGEEYQTEFITDLQTQIDILKKNTGSATKDYVSDYVSDYTYDKETIDSMIGSVGGEADLSNYYNKQEIDKLLENMFYVESVKEYPASYKHKTIYLVQGIVKVI